MTLCCFAWSAFFLGCSSQKQPGKPVLATPLPEQPREVFTISPLMRVGEKLPVVDDHSGLGEEQIGMDFCLTGLLEVRDGMYTLVENPKNRSPVQFALSFAARELELTARRFNGYSVIVTGTLTAFFSPWYKELRVTQIQILD